MSIYQSLAGMTENLVKAMKDFQGQNYAFDVTKKNGALDFILGPQNTSRVESELLTAGGGKLRKARVVYKQSFTTDDVSTGTTAEGAGLCDTSSQPEPKEVIIDIDNANSMAAPLGFTEDKLRLYAENPEAFMNEYLFNQLARQREKLDEQILTAIMGGSGVNYEEDGGITAAGSSKSVELLNADGTPKYQGLDEILGDYENNGMVGIPAIIGNGKFAKFFRLQNLVCCNSATPFDQAVADAGVAWYKDQNAASILESSDDILVVAPGATKFISYNENEHVTIPETALVKHLVIPDPVYGNALKWDLDFKWDECSKKYVWFTRVYFTVFNTFQADSFPSGSANYENVTGIFEYKATQGA